MAELEKVTVVDGEDLRRGEAGGEEERRDAQPRGASGPQGEEWEKPDQVLRREDLGAEHERKYKRRRIPWKRLSPESPEATIFPVHHEPRDGEENERDGGTKGSRE